MLVVRYSRVVACLQVLAFAVFLVFWYGFFYLTPDARPDLHGNWFMWFFFLGPLSLLLSYRSCVEILRTCLKGSSYEFDAGNRTIKHNGRFVASFGNIRKVMISDLSDTEDGRDSFCVSLVRDDHKRIVLTTTSEEPAARVAEEMADFFGLSIDKEYGWRPGALHPD